MAALLIHIFICKKSDYTVLVVNHREFLDLICIKFFLCRLNRRSAFLVHNLLGHDILDKDTVVVAEAEVSGCHDTTEAFVSVYYWDTRCIVYPHKSAQVCKCGILVDYAWVLDNPVKISLYFLNFLSLLNRLEIAVYYTHSTLKGQCNSHAGVGYSVHSGGHDRNIHINITDKPGCDISLARSNVSISRNQQNIIKTQTFVNF